MNRDKWRTIRADLPVDDWHTLAEHAATHGLTVGIYARQVLLAEMESAVSDPSDTQPVKRQALSDLQVISVYKESNGAGRLVPTFDKRSQLRAWAIEQGFKFPETLDS